MKIEIRIKKPPPHQEKKDKIDSPQEKPKRSSSPPRSAGADDRERDGPREPEDGGDARGGDGDEPVEDRRREFRRQRDVR